MAADDFAPSLTASNPPQSVAQTSYQPLITPSILATGVSNTVDDVIAYLQSIGLARQS